MMQARLVHCLLVENARVAETPKPRAERSWPVYVEMNNRAQEGARIEDKGRCISLVEDYFG